MERIPWPACLLARRWGWLAAVVLAGSVPHLAQAQLLPAGSEFQVNTYTTRHQRTAAVASDADGDFVVVWQSEDQDGDEFGIIGQRYSSAGTPVGSEFQVNTFTAVDQETPAVAMDASGDFVVVWDSIYGPTYGGIFGQRFDGAGAAVGSEFQVSTYTTDEILRPAVASEANGDFVAVWESYGQDGSGTGIFGQRFSSAGTPLGGEFQVNSYSTSYQRFPSVDVDADGDFVVVWESYGQDGSGRGIFGQRFSTTGAPAGGEFQINAYTTSLQSNPGVAMESNGDFIAVWVGLDGSSSGIRGQRFSSAGASVGAEFPVNTYTTGSQGESHDGPAVAADADGDFVVVWRGYNQDGSNTGILARHFDSTGAPVGNDFVVNTYTTNFQIRAAVAADGTGDFVVVWDSFTQDGNSYGVFGQRYVSPTPPPPVPIFSGFGMWLAAGLLGIALRMRAPSAPSR